MGAALISVADGVVEYDAFALEVPSLSLYPGIYWITGPNGSGKTTLFRALLGLEPFSRGAVSRGEELSRGYLPQNFRDALFPWLTAKDNLCLFGGSEDFLFEWARQLGLQEKELTQRTYHLSGGQAQRLALVREAALRPQLLILDEPFSALDVTASEAAAHLLLEVSALAGGVIIFTNHGSLPAPLADSSLHHIEITRVSDDRSRVMAR